jgi:hypothetical protein
MMKKSAKVLHNPYSAIVWDLGDTELPSIKCKVTAYFGDRFVEKEDDLRRRSKMIGGIFVADQNFEHRLKIQA